VIAAALADASKGHFTLGIGPSAINSAAYRKRLGVNNHPPLALMREYFAVLRPLLAGESVNFDGEVVKLSGASLGFKPPRVPLHLGAMAENLLRLAGEIADGATLNWCSAERHRWSRERVEKGARAAGRIPSSVILSSHIRVCVDDDVEVARRGLANAVSHYALVEPGESTTTSYRGQFGRMGFDEILTDLEARRDAGEPMEKIIDAIPDQILDVVGCYGTPDMVGPQFARLAAGVDIPIVRVVNPRPGLEGARAVIRACRPEVISRIAV
jgi:alkanesulfonate monooxygenase SsuD/methylene tetrahydromethanopterin reductase-like flavin-dependent oxidoreductase (luciferase family)